MWSKDNLQIIFDTLHKFKKGDLPPTQDENIYCYEVGLLNEGATLYNHPMSKPFSKVNGSKVAIKRNNNHTIYEVAIPKESLAPFKLESGEIAGYNLIVNDSDNEGRKGWIGITLGIGESLNPGLYQDLILMK